MDHKILTRLLAERLKVVLSSYIHQDQKRFLPDSNMGYNILDIYSVLALSKEEDIENLIISLDFYKAFDSVEWNYMFVVMESMQFPEVFISWIKMIYNSNESRIINDGVLSDPFLINRGLFQGNCLSPLLFLLCIEPLAQFLE